MPKPLRDTQLHQVMALRYRGVRCGRSVRRYPMGLSHDQSSARLKGVAVMFSVLGMSDGAVASALSALGWLLSKVAVYYAVQEAGAAGADLLRAAEGAERGYEQRFGGEAAMKSTFDRYRASTHDTCPITTRVSVVAWVTPLIKGYNRPLEQLWQMFELRPFGGVDVSAAYLAPPAIDVAGVGSFAFAPHDPGAPRR